MRFPILMQMPVNLRAKEQERERDRDRRDALNNVLKHG